jgi:ribosomal protein L5
MDIGGVKEAAKPVGNLLY